MAVTKGILFWVLKSPPPRNKLLKYNIESYST